MGRLGLGRQHHRRLPRDAGPRLPVEPLPPHTPRERPLVLRDHGEYSPHCFTSLLSMTHDPVTGGGEGDLLPHGAGALLFVLQAAGARPEPGRGPRPAARGQHDRVRPRHQHPREVRGCGHISRDSRQCRTCCRFNVYQEVVLAAIYKFYDFRQPPILFYVYAVFCLQVRPRATCHITRVLCSVCRVFTSAASTCWPGASRAPGWPACSPPPWSPPAGDT